MSGTTELVHAPDDVVLKAINACTVSDADLLDPVTWRHICDVRDRHRNAVETDSWICLCAQQNSLLHARGER